MGLYRVSVWTKRGRLFVMPSMTRERLDKFIEGLRGAANQFFQQPDGDVPNAFVPFHAIDSVVIEACPQEPSHE